jgi:AGZA family xanthine/uracil permease-like MFS transporter
MVPLAGIAYTLSPCDAHLTKDRNQAAKMEQENLAAGPLERFFKLSEHGTSVRTELIAGATTFVTMAYIIFVNPQLMASAGMDAQAAFVATCLASALACYLMGLYAN